MKTEYAMPAELTAEMEEAIQDALDDCYKPKQLYSALLAAAPKPSAEPVGYGLLGRKSRTWDGETFVKKSDAGGYDSDALLPLFAGQPPAVEAQEQPAPIPTSAYFTSRVADLLHLLQFAAIVCQTDGDREQAFKAMDDIMAYLTRPQNPEADA